MKSKMHTFGWSVNPDADGFETEHGRLTIEVFWDDVVSPETPWNILVYDRMTGNQVHRSKVAKLGDAKSRGISVASKAERLRISVDNNPKAKVPSVHI